MGQLVLVEERSLVGNSELVEVKTQLPEPPWTWRDRAGNYHYPEKMHSRHLFMTLRMIWNNTVPEDQWIGDVKLYEFKPEYYSAEYFAEAVRHLGAEIQTRTDLLPEWIEQLKQMIPGFDIVGRITRG